MIQETTHEICVVAEYKDGGSFCLAKFMYEEDAREYLGTKKDKEYVKWKLCKRKGGLFGDEVQWEPLDK